MKFEVICWNLLHSLQMIKGQVCRFGGIQRWESTLLTVVFSRPTLCYLSFFQNCFGLLWARYGGTAFYVNKSGHDYQIKICFGCLVLVTLSKKEHACTCLFHFISLELFEMLHLALKVALFYLFSLQCQFPISFPSHLMTAERVSFDANKLCDHF